MPPLLFKTTLLERRDYGCASELVFRVPPGFQPHPGQFLHILCDGEGRLLRRPFSVFGHNGRSASVLVREVGGGSAWLRRRMPGDELDVLGPLGRGFDLDGEEEEALLIAGGAGVAPLVYLGQRLRERGVRATLFWGMESGKEYGTLPERLGEEIDLRLATTDGSRGKRGTVLDLLPCGSSGAGFRYYACGPRPMLLSLASRLAPGGLSSLQVSVEERMACGLGACRGCAVPVADPPGAYRAACREGPVFGGEELDWERLRVST